MIRSGKETMMHRRYPARAGFTLIETIIGIALLAISVVGSFEILRLADLQAKHTSIDNRIAELLREYSDYALYLDYNRLPNDGDKLGEGYLYQIYDSVSKATKGFYHYLITVNVQTYDPGTTGEYKEIIVRVDYQADDHAFYAQLITQTIVSDAITRSKS
jgi:prepilin-type N-terminal cleavage/methylation domain-containing protein